jgi:hypothetical protein
VCQVLAPKRRGAYRPARDLLTHPDMAHREESSPFTPTESARASPHRTKRSHRLWKRIRVRHRSVRATRGIGGCGGHRCTVAKESIFMKTITDNFTPFYAPLIPLLNRLRKIVFPKDKPWEREDEKLYSRIREVLRQGREELK